MLTDDQPVDVQQGVQALSIAEPDPVETHASVPSPSLENGSADGVRCGRCGTSNPAGLDRCASCQSWLPRNAGAVRTGIYRREQPEDIRLTARELVDGIVSDLGGFDALSTVERAYVSHLSDVSTLLRLLVNDLVINGVFTPAKNVRAVYDKYLVSLDRFDRLAQRVGLKRRPKDLTSPLDYLEGRDR